MKPKEYIKKWRERNPEKDKLHRLNYRNKHRKELYEAQKAYYQKNKEYYSNITKEWALQHPTLRKIYKQNFINKHPNYWEEWNKIHNNNLDFGGNKYSVLERDNWECQECGLTAEQHIIIFGRNMSVHHIDCNHTNNNTNNLITLCSRCHTTLHHKITKTKRR